MKKYYHFKQINSTSTYLKKNYLKHDNLDFVSASFQSEGHGRTNRKWVSEKGENLLFSVLIKDQKIIKDFAYISLFSALEIMHILKEINIKDVSIKWPNDVFVNDKKICGILLESVSYTSDIDALILGIGINVNSSCFLGDYLIAPTSIFLETKKMMDLEKFKLKVFSVLEELLKNISLKKEEYLKEIKENNYLKDKEVYALINNDKTKVKVLDINDDCSLKVLCEDKIININSGEISFHIKSPK